jgi:hypothetical protein
MTPLEAYIRAAAQQRGINPDIAVRVARGEGGLNNPFRHGEAPAPRSQAAGLGATENSYGPFQLYVSGTGAGLGDRAIAAGIDPRKDWQGGINYALDEVRRKGWGQWYGARAAGITGMQGVGGGGGNNALVGGSSGYTPPAASILHPEIDPTPSADNLTAPGPVFGSMSPGGPPAGAAQWALAPDAGKKPGIGDRLSAAGQAIDNAVMPAAKIQGGMGDARQGVPDLMKLLGNPNAYAQALMQRRMG